MNTTRNGKIAKLPKAIREELSHRLEDGEAAAALVKWLNQLPEVRAVRRATGMRPIREQNISEWRKGGYRDWLAKQEALELAVQLGEDAAELSVEGRPPLTDTLALWLTARYAVATRQVAATEGAEGWRLLRELCADIVELRRGDHSAAKLKLEQDRLAEAREKTEEEVIEFFKQWAGNANVRAAICGPRLSPEERHRKIMAVFGRVAPLPETGPPGPAADQREEA
jgi:hypothetical protein